MIRHRRTRFLSSYSYATGIVVLACLASHAHGRTIALYEAGTGSVVWNPYLHWGWLPEEIQLAGDPRATPIVNDLGSGLNSWSLNDNALGSPNPAYVMSFDSGGPGLVSEILNDGWRYTVRARYVSDYGGGPGMGLNVYLGGRAYLLLIDQSASGGLQATLFDSMSRVHALAPPGSSVTAFHTFELRSPGGAAPVTFYFDTQAIGSWSGVGAVHPNIIRWGSSAANNRGQMNFHRVEFATLEAAVPGDYNADRAVDAADYAFWRNHLGSNLAAADGSGNGSVDLQDFFVWRMSFGSSVVPATSVPEPPVVACLFAISLGSVAKRHGFLIR